MQRFWSDCKGAVTVFVTLLLIPAILVSGTAVDLARIYTARSTVQNANQLAANSVLAGYNALLNDLYGLYGFMKDDPHLTDMINEYIALTVFGRDITNELGTLRSFYGAGDDFTAAPSFHKELSEIPVLRRQILEYMKFRAPLILAEQLFESLSGLDKLSEDMEIVEAKQELDESMEELFQLYYDLYDAIVAADKCPSPTEGISGAPFNQITGNFNRIREHLRELSDLRKILDEAESDEEDDDDDDEGDDDDDEDDEDDEDEEDKLEELKEKYASVIADIKVLALTIRSNVEGSVQNAENFKDKFGLVLEIAKEIDEKKADLQRKFDELENKLERGECSPELREALFTEKDAEGKTVMDYYRVVLAGEIASLAEEYRSEGNSFLNSVIEMLNDVRYREYGVPMTDTNSLTLGQLENLAETILEFSIEDTEDETVNFADFVQLNWVLPRKPPGALGSPTTFKKFSECSDLHAEFFDDLKKLAEVTAGSSFVDITEGPGEKPAGSKTAEQAQRENIEKLENMEFNDDEIPLSGAEYIDPGYAETKTGIKIDGIAKNIIDFISDPLNTLKNTGDYALILTYDTAVFSCYTTTKPDSIGKDPADIDYKKTITGIPMNPKVNYFYQSEMEYIFNGSHTAKDNLDFVKGLIFAVRAIVNYIAVFSINEVTAIVNAVKAIPIPFGINLVLGEIARAAFAAAESAMDVSRIRSGYRVTFIKTSSTWRCVPSKLFSDPKEHDASGLVYENYMLIFFVGKAFFTGGISEAADDLVKRTGELAEWNMVNYIKKLNADEAAMTEALTDSPFKLDNAATGIGITTSVEMRMMFLSMPFAQKGISGVVPPRTFPVISDDYRGY